tara:strand:+ start:12 stop:224 length:213 start_codon:yes stop_codon:yes gene_type:complete
MSAPLAAQYAHSKYQHLVKPKPTAKSKLPKPEGSLLTESKKTKRKKIYGMGGSQDEEKSDTVKKSKLGGY